MHNTLFIILSVLLFSTKVARSQSFDSLYQHGIEQEKYKQEKKALHTFGEAQKLQPTNLAVLYKCGELCSRIGARETNQANKLAYFEQSLNYAKQAYKYHSNSDEANVLMSMALGRIALQKSGKQKIEYVKLIKQYAEKAIKLNSSNFKAWHIIGKWNYELSNLNFIEKAAIKLFYGGLPDASLEKSVVAYEKAKSIQNNFALNSLELAKAYHKINQHQQAKNNLLYVMNLPNNTEDDAYIKKEAAELLKKWKY